MHAAVARLTMDTLCGRGDEWHNGEEHGEGEDRVVVVTVGRGNDNDNGCPIL